LDDDQNACQAHFTASKSANGWNALPVLNYAIFLLISDSPKNRDSIIQLMMEFEQLWLKRKQNSVEFEENVMKAATRLANALNVSKHMAWVKEAEQQNSIQSTSNPIGNSVSFKSHTDIIASTTSD
jgi:hypothetical protein